MADLQDQISHLYARQAALECAVVQIIIPLLLQAAPAEKLASLTGKLRTDMMVRLPNGGNEYLQIIADEYVQQLADQIEHRVRAAHSAD